mgnify:CR=1 FL=1
MGEACEGAQVRVKSLPDQWFCEVCFRRAWPASARLLSTCAPRRAAARLLPRLRPHISLTPLPCLASLPLEASSS